MYYYLFWRKSDLIFIFLYIHTGHAFCICKKYFDSLTLKHFGFYVSLVRHFEAYSQPFNLVYK
jgi:hypothetical protein